MNEDKLDKIIADHQKWLNDNTEGARANLCGADLSGASLSSANLRRASLSRANLRYADLIGAKIADVFWCAPPVVLLANWGKCSDALTVQLMMYDASNHHDPKSFDTWKKTTACPYSGVKYQRAANFTESAKLWPGWNPRKKIKSAYQLMQFLLEEHCDTTKGD